MPDVAILGSGAVGALLGAALTRVGVDATLVTREESAARLSRDGLWVQSPVLGDGRIDVPATDRLRVRAPALLVAVKAPQLALALERVEVDPEVVVPVLNGVDHLALLRRRFGAATVVAGVVRVQAHRESPTHVVHRTPLLAVGLAAPGAPDLARALARAGVAMTTGAPEADVLWGKLSRLAGLALATTAADAPLGRVRPEAEAVAREVVAVATAEGAAIDAEVIVQELRDLPDAASSSLRADVLAGAPDHELDAIAGAVLRAAARHGLAAPRTADLAARVAARAAGSL